MSRKRKRGAKATAASMVMDTLKKRGAVDEKSAEIGRASCRERVSEAV